VCPAHVIYGILTGKANPYALTRHICRMLEIRFLKTRASHELCPAPKTRVIYLCNHRSWADFFCDQVICAGASYLSRLLVWVGTPVSSLYGWMAHSTWYFNRKRGIDRQAFAKFMDEEWSKRPTFGMIAYPEGTRNQTQTHLPLKTGVLQYAYEYKRAVQCVVTANKEAVCNEKRFSVGRGVALVTSISPVVDPAGFDSMEAFVAKVREEFARSWDDAYNTKTTEALEYEPPMGHTPPSFTPVVEPSKVAILRVVVLLLTIFSSYRFLA